MLRVRPKRVWHSREESVCRVLSALFGLSIVQRSRSIFMIACSRRHAIVNGYSLSLNCIVVAYGVNKSVTNTKCYS